MTIRKLSAVLLVSMLFFGATLAQAADLKTKLTLTVAAASTTDEAYTLQVPADLSLTGAGWNSVGNITVSYGGSNSGFDSSKKLVVTAASENGGLTSTTDSSQVIGYTIKSAESDTAAVTTFEFSASEINTEGGTSKTIGVTVDDYTGKAAGTYENYIVYTAEVQSAATTITVTWNNDDITGSGPSFTKDGVTVTAGMIDFDNKNFMGGGTFTTTLGNFTRIEVTAADFGELGTGWTVNDNTATWEGDASKSVSFSNNIMGEGNGVKFTFTITSTSGE